MFKVNKHFRRLRFRDKVVVIITMLLMLGILAIALYNAAPLFSFIAPAYAAEASAVTAYVWDHKAIINLAIMAFVLGAGGVAIYTVFFSDDATRVQTANDYLKMILGFLLGIAKGLLGV